MYVKRFPPVLEMDTRASGAIQERHGWGSAFGAL